MSDPKNNSQEPQAVYFPEGLSTFSPTEPPSSGFDNPVKNMTPEPPPGSLSSGKANLISPTTAPGAPTSEPNISVNLENLFGSLIESAADSLKVKNYRILTFFYILTFYLLLYLLCIYFENRSLKNVDVF